MKMFFVLPYSCLTISLLLFSFSTKVNAITVTARGTIIESTCTSGVGGVIPFDLGQDIPASTFDAANSSSSYVSKDVLLSGCSSAITSVTATFSGTSDSLNPTMYANTTGNGGAGNLAVQLQNALTTTDVGNSATMTVNTVNNSATFPLRARLYSLRGTVTPGAVNAAVVMSITYN
ncbi:fimbrial protein [Enterobacter adelaidei]